MLRMMLPLEQHEGLAPVSGSLTASPRRPELTLVGLIEHEVDQLRAEPDATASTLYRRLVFEGWDADRIAAALRFGGRPWLRFREGLPPPSDRDGTAIRRHRSRLLGAAVLDGGRLCSWSDDGRVSGWDLASSQLVWWLGSHHELTAAAVTPDSGVLLTAAADGQVAAWNLRSNAALLWESPPTGAGVTLLAVGGGGSRVLAAFADGCVCAFDVTSGQLSQLAGPGATVRHAAQAGAATMVIGDDSGVLRWYDLSSGQRQRELAAHAASIVCLDADRDRLTSASEDGSICWWNAATGERLGQHQGVLGLRGARWTAPPHECLVMWGRDGVVSTMQDGRETALTVHRGEVTDVRIVPPRDRRANRVRRGKPLVVSCSADGTVEIRHYDSIAAFDTLDVHNAPVLGCTELPATGEIIAWDDDGRLAGWLPGGRRPHRLFGEASNPHGVRLHYSVSPRSLLVSDRRQLLCHDAGRSMLFPGPPIAAQRVRWPRTLIVDEHLGLVDERSVETKMRERTTRQQLPWKVISPASGRAFRHFASGLDFQGADGVAIGLNGERRWVAVTWTRSGQMAVRTEGDRRYRPLAGHRSRISDAVWMTRDNLATASWDGTLRCLSLERSSASVLEGHVGRVLGCLAQNHETLVSWGDDRTIRAWRPAERQVPVAVLELPDVPSAAAVLRDERLIVGTRHGHLLVVDPTVTTCSNPVGAHQRRVAGVAPITIQSSGVGAVSCGDDARVRVWRIGADHIPVHEDVAVCDAPFTGIVPLGARANAVALLDEPGAVWVYEAGPPPWSESPEEQPPGRTRSRAGVSNRS